MKKDWLWDRKISISESKKILKNPEDVKFILMASLLLAREADPGEVFGDYLDPIIFCKNWQKIKRRMAQDKWANPRIIFWQAIYEKLLDKYRKEGTCFIRNKDVTPMDSACVAIGREIRKVRKEKGLSQDEIAEKAGVSQQLISRIEKGRENISLITLKKISGALNRRVEISFV
ncbi:MAG: helix-turn-helix transcriptional regulator [Candidatus Omnitrophota bacterium]|nr:helix-turn-helix transcriptional regulator [Candidatus Omnitrophota bacterium]